MHIDKKEHYSGISQKLDLCLTCTGFLKKKQLRQNSIPKPRVKIMRAPARTIYSFSAMEHFNGTHTPMHVERNWGKGR